MLIGIRTTERSDRPVPTPYERRPGHLLRPAALRVFPEAVSRRQNPDGPPAASGNRRRNRLLLPRQRPRSARNADHPAPSQDQRTGARSTSPSTTKSSGNFRRSISNASSAGWQDKTALQLPNYVEHPLIEVFKASFRRPPSPISAWKCIAAWACSTASAWCARAIRPFAAPPATWRNSSWMFRIEGEIVRAPAWFDSSRSDSWLRHYTPRRRRFVRHVAASRFHQGTDQPDARHAAALDAIRRALHALHCRRRRTSLSSPGRSAGNHLCQPRHH